MASATSPAYRNPEIPEIETRRDVVSLLMVVVHQISPELAREHVREMAPEEMDRRLRMYQRSLQRSLAAVELLTRIKLQDPELWQRIRTRALEIAAGEQVELCRNEMRT